MLAQAAICFFGCVIHLQVCFSIFICGCAVWSMEDTVPPLVCVCMCMCSLYFQEHFCEYAFMSCTYIYMSCSYIEGVICAYTWTFHMGCNARPTISARISVVGAKFKSLSPGVVAKTSRAPLCMVPFSSWRRETADFDLKPRPLC